MPTEELLNAREVADRLGVSAATVRFWALRGRIPSIRISCKVVRFDWDEVLAITRRHRAEARRDQPVDAPGDAHAGFRSGAGARAPASSRSIRSVSSSIAASTRAHQRSIPVSSSSAGTAMGGP